MNENQSTSKRFLKLGINLAAWVFFFLGLLCFFMVSLMIWKGGIWAYIIYVAKPFHNLASGIVSMLIWYLVLFGRHNTRAEWKNFGAKIMLLTLSLMFSLITAELFLRVYYTARQNANSMERFKAARKNGKPIPVHSTHPLAAIIQPSDNQKLVYELQPGLDMDFGHRRVRTNSEGMRKDREYPEQKNTNCVRIIGIGDSGMFGWNTEQNENYLDVLEVNLNKQKDGRTYDVLNFAVPGYNTQLEVEMLKSRGLKFKPDIVIVGWCENDYSLPFFLLEKENYRSPRKSFVYDLMFKRSMNQPEVAPGFAVKDQRDYNSDLVLPELNTGVDPSGVKSALIELKNLGDKNGFKALVFGPMGELICKMCKQIGVPYTSTFELIPEGKYPADYLIHFMHPTKEGHSILAGYLENELIRRGWLPPANRLQ